MRDAAGWTCVWVRPARHRGGNAANRVRPLEVRLPRLPRYVAPGYPQHVIQRGNNRSVLFIDDADYRFYYDCLHAACERHGCRVHAYVFMTNHVHLLMTPSADGAIGKVMQSVGRRYVQRFNTTYQRSGTLWEGRYKATLVDTDAYLLACYRYIELNPVRAGLVRRAGDYRWSSHRANAFGEADPLVTSHERYAALAADAVACQSAYRDLFDVELAESTLAEIRDGTQRGWALGSKRFREEIAALLKRRTEPSKRRPDPRWNDTF